MITSNHECMMHANMHYIAIHSYRVNCVSIITFFTKDPHYTIETHIPELLIRFSFPLFNESSTSLLAWPGGRKLQTANNSSEPSSPFTKICCDVISHSWRLRMSRSCRNCGTGFQNLLRCDFAFMEVEVFK